MYEFDKSPFGMGDGGDAPTDLYDAASGRLLTRRATGKTKLPLPPDTAAVMTLLPHKGP